MHSMTLKLAMRKLVPGFGGPVAWQDLAVEIVVNRCDDTAKRSKHHEKNYNVLSQTLSETWNCQNQQLNALIFLL
jgi:hypothetical protein